MVRRRSREIKLGKLTIGGENPIVVQSMTNTDTRNVSASIEQIINLENAGCELVRVAVPDMEAAIALKTIKKSINIPLVADIHFDYRLAIQAVQSNVDGLRINPGNIGDKYKIQELVKVCQDNLIPIRVGVNAGSLDKRLIKKHGGVNASAMVESAMDNIKILEDMGFQEIKVSLKSSSILMTINAYQAIANLVDYPLHVGITEAGTKDRGLIKSSLGIGVLLYQGIGDTIRISLTADPIEEVWATYELLRALELRNRGVELISCPTCGRSEIDLIRLAEEVDEKVRFLDVPLKIAVMGCVVNGPGEAREADLGIAGGRGTGILFKKGEVLKKVAEHELKNALLNEIDELIKSKKY